MKIICEHCGTNIDTFRDNICPNCKAPYDKNKSYIKKKEEQEKFKQESMEYGKNIVKKANSTTKIFVIMFISILAIGILSFLFTFIKTLDVFNSSNKITEKETEIKTSPIELSYTNVLFEKEITWNGRSMYKAKNGYTYVLININIKNNTKEKIYINDSNILCSINGVIQENETFYLHDYKELPTSLEPNFIAEGYVAYEVLEDAKEFDLTFKDVTIHVNANQ